VKAFFDTLINFLFSFIIIQCIISIILIPLYSAWGIPFTMCTFIGNLLITPFFSLFLIISFIFFILLIFSFTSHYIALLMKYLSCFILKILSYTQNYSFFYICFQNNCFFVSAISIIAGICLIILPYTFQISKKMYSLVCCASLIIIISIIKYSERDITMCIIKDNKTPMALVCKHSNKLYVFDYRSPKKRHVSNKYWINYTILPNLSKIFGTICIARYYVKYLKEEDKSYYKNLLNTTVERFL
jgi:hypothetical protein